MKLPSKTPSPKTRPLPIPAAARGGEPLSHDGSTPVDPGSDRRAATGTPVGPLRDALNLCGRWAADVNREVGFEGIYLFGSAIHRDGLQFDPVSSDLDLVVLIPSNLRADVRVRRLDELRRRKQQLELSLIPVLGRSDASSDIVSIVPITSLELLRDVHKSRVRDFFRASLFLDLLQPDRAPQPLRPARSPAKLDDRVRQVLEFTQGLRNSFVAVSASGRRQLAEWSEKADPLPKDLMRMAALAASLRSGAVNHGPFDLQEGLDHLSGLLGSHRALGESYQALADWLSMRRGARGNSGPLSPAQRLMLAEMLSDAVLIRNLPRADAERAVAHRGATPQVSTGGRQTPLRVNGYKLFYLRHNVRKLSFSGLAKVSGVDRNQLRRLEKVDTRHGALDPQRFAPCDQETLTALETALSSPNMLKAGNGDDFLTLYSLYHETHKGRSPSQPGRGNQASLGFPTKVVVFDFDGTLTQGTDIGTTWEKLWAAMGYHDGQCFDLHHRYRHNEFDHQTWCNMTRDAFRARGMTEAHLVRIADETPLVAGVAETAEMLRVRGVRLYILSGSIKSIIRHTLGPLATEFEEIRANSMVFDEHGVVKEIQGTLFDFEGKALYLKRLVRDLKLSPSDILFVGNSCNDIYASRSGVRTLCVNPRLTDPDNQEHWTYAISKMKDLREILVYTQG